MVEYPDKNNPRTIMDIKNESLLTCSCCKKNVNKVRFIPHKNRLEKNFLLNGDLILCFECAGFYLYETYLKNSTNKEIETIIGEIQEIREPAKKDDDDGDEGDGDILEEGMFIEEKTYAANG